MAHVILLGYSIYDNASYVPDRPVVIDQLRESLLKDWKATLLAVDGETPGRLPATWGILPGALRYRG